jgi:hypothetical protein
MEPKDVAVRYIDALNRDDWQAMDALFSADAQVTMPGFEISGREAIVRHYERAVGGYFSYHSAEPTRIVSDGETVFILLSIDTSVNGGERRQSVAVDIFDVSMGRITKLTVVTDTASFGR